jgi:hypothetical protein
MKTFLIFVVISATMILPCSALSEDFTLVVIPDTQKYSELYPHIFTAQTQWIKDNIGNLNIKFVMHVGDVVQNLGNEIEEWENADESMGILDGVIPYLVVPGNHDYDLPGTIGLETFNSYFPVSRFNAYSWYGGHYPADGSQNNYGFFSADGEEFMVIGIEWEPDSDILTWADGIIGANQDKTVILFTHWYLDASGEIPDRVMPIWDGLVSKYPNIIMVHAGHIHTMSRRTDIVGSNPVYQIAQGSPKTPNGGNGWLRYYTFKPDEEKISARTYSPYLQQYDTSSTNQFDLAYGQPECMDDDPGQNKFVRGKCVDIYPPPYCGPNGCEDMCDNGFLYDYFCHTRDGKTYCASSRDTCGAGYRCSNGICVEDGTVNPFCAKTWTRGNSARDSAIWAIAYDDQNNILVAVGDPPNPITRSVDTGKTWSASSYSVAVSEHITGTAYGDGVFLASLMRAGEIIMSDDGGVTWETVYSVGKSYSDPSDISYGNGRFVVTWPDGTVSTSESGRSGTWSSVFKNAYMRSLAYGNGRFLTGTANRRVYSTTDGTNVQHVGTASDRHDTITHCSGSSWVSGGAHLGGHCLSSNNGNSWTCKDGLLGDRAKFYASTHIHGNTFIAGDGKAGSSSIPVFMSPDCGETWSELSSGLPHVILSMVSTGSRVIAGDATGKIAYSSTISGVIDCQGTGTCNNGHETYFMSYGGPLCNDVTDEKCVNDGDDENDNACCPDDDDCVYGGNCYAEGTYTDLNGNGLIDGWCMTSDSYKGHWRDCDDSENVCNGECNHIHAQGGELSDFGEYDTGTETECCGDDSNEYAITLNSMTRCCDSPDDTLDFTGNCIDRSADINNDGTVDIIDLGLVIGIFGVGENDPEWNATMDVIADGGIDIFDLVLVAGRFT